MTEDGTAVVLLGWRKPESCALLLMAVLLMAAPLRPAAQESQPAVSPKKGESISAAAAARIRRALLARVTGSQGVGSLYDPATCFAMLESSLYPQTVPITALSPAIQDIFRQVDTLYSQRPSGDPAGLDRIMTEIRARLEDAMKISWNDRVTLAAIAKRADDMGGPYTDIAFELATKALRRAVELKGAPADQAALAYLLYGRSLAPIYAQLRPALLDEAEQLARAAAMVGTFEYYSLLGDILSSQERWAEAEAQYTLALKKGSDACQTDRAINGLVWCAYGRKEPKEADRLFALLQTKTVDDWISRGYQLEEQGRVLEAAEAYMIVAKAGFADYYCRAAPNFLAAATSGRIAHNVTARARENDALDVARKCIAAFPTPSNLITQDIASAHFVIADVLLSRGVYSSAAEHARSAIALNPGAPFFHYSLARALMGLREFPGAVRALNKAIELSDGEWAHMHFDLGAAYFELGDFERARQSFETAARLNPKDDLAAYNVGVCNRRLGNLPEAETWFEESVRRNPDRAKRKLKDKVELRIRSF